MLEIFPGSAGRRQYNIKEKHYLLQVSANRVTAIGGVGAIRALLE